MQKYFVFERKINLQNGKKIVTKKFTLLRFCFFYYKKNTFLPKYFDGKKMGVLCSVRFHKKIQKFFEFFKFLFNFFPIRQMNGSLISEILKNLKKPAIKYPPNIPKSQSTIRRRWKNMAQIKTPSSPLPPNHHFNFGVTFFLIKK